MTIETIGKYLLYLFFILFPFYSAIRVYELPFNLFLIGLLYLLLLLKIFYEKKIIIPKTFFSSFIFSLSFLLLGILLYSKFNIVNFLPILWVSTPMIFVNLIKDKNVYLKIFKLLFYSSSFMSVLVMMKFFEFLNLNFIKIHTHKNGVIRVFGIGDSPNPNSFSILLLFVLVFSFIYYKKSNVFKNIIFLFLSFPLLLTLFLSKSRGVIVGFFISILGLFIFTPLRKYFSFKKFLYALIILSMFLTVFFTLPAGKLAFKRLKSSESSNRFQRWEAVINIWTDHLLIGVGFDNLAEKTAELYGIEKKNAHNAYLQLLSGTGLIGFSLFLMFIVDVYILLYKYINELSEIYLYFIVFTTFFIFNFSHSMIFIPIFWIFLGLLEVRGFFIKKVKRRATT